MRVEHGVATSAGRVRPLNEDAHAACAPVFVVADGMGGHAAGEVASAAAVQVFEDLALRGPLTPADVVDAVRTANEAIVERAAATLGRTGMGTTLAGVVAVEAGDADHWLVVNVGDSRVYRWSDGGLQQLSTDHSEVQERVNSGELTRAEARTHPRRHVVTRSLGHLPGPVADSWLLPATLGERFVVCSDGLVAEVEDDDIALLLRGRSPQEAADALVAAAVDAGGRDNVTVVVVDVLSVDEGVSVDDDTVPRVPA